MKRNISILLIISLLFTLFPVFPSVYGDSFIDLETNKGDITITDTGYSYENESEISNTESYRLSGAMSSGIIIESGIIDLTISDLNLSTTSSGIYIKPGAVLNLTVDGDNKIEAGAGFAGIGVEAGWDTSSGDWIWDEDTSAVLNILGTGSLTVIGGDGVSNGVGGGAGIGGNGVDVNYTDGADCGVINIQGATITAIGGNGSISPSNQQGSGAGIGGGGSNIPGYWTYHGMISLSKGEVTASGGCGYTGAPGIGNGSNGNTSYPVYSNMIIEINDGTVIATGGTSAAGIGGSTSSDSGDIYIYGGNIEAYGGSESDGSYGGAGIGGGSDGSAKLIYIEDATVYAKAGGGAAGIGGGYNLGYNEITITGDSDVEAIGSSYYSNYYKSWYSGAGIGCGLNALHGAGEINIDTTGFIKAYGITGANAIGVGSKFNPNPNGSYPTPKININTEFGSILALTDDSDVSPIYGLDTFTTDATPLKVSNSSVFWNNSSISSNVLYSYNGNPFIKDLYTYLIDNSDLTIKTMDDSNLKSFNIGSFDVKNFAYLVNHTISVSFDNNGGQGSMQDKEVGLGDFTLPTCEFTPPTDMKFVGWSLAPSGPIIQTSTLNITEDTVLYAIYEDIVYVNLIVNIVGNGTVNNQSSCTLRVPKSESYDLIINPTKGNKIDSIKLNGSDLNLDTYNKKSLILTNDSILDVVFIADSDVSVNIINPLEEIEIHENNKVSLYDTISDSEQKDILEGVISSYNLTVYIENIENIESKKETSLLNQIDVSAIVDRHINITAEKVINYSDLRPNLVETVDVLDKEIEVVLNIESIVNNIPVDKNREISLYLTKPTSNRGSSGYITVPLIDKDSSPNSYTFDIKELGLVSLVYKDSVKTFDIVFKNFNNDLLYTHYDVNYGEMPIYNGSNPVRNPDDYYTYTFNSWSPEIVPAISDTEYIADYSKSVRYFEVIFEPNDGSTNSFNTNTNDEYKLSSLPSLTRENYHFDGWYTDMFAGEKIDLNREYHNDTILYAHWIPSTNITPIPSKYALYKVEHYKQENNDYVLSDTEFPLYGEIGEVKSATLKDYGDMYVVNDKKSSLSGTVITPYKDEVDKIHMLILKVYYDFVSPLITFDANGGTSSKVSDNVNIDGKLGTLPTSVKTNYSFKGWNLKKDGSGEFVDTNTVFNQDTTVYAIYTYVGGSSGGGGGGGGSITHYTIKAEANIGGTISPLGLISVVRGSDKVFNFSASSGYIISDIIIDGKSIGSNLDNYIFKDIKKSHTIKVEFKKSINETETNCCPNPELCPSRHLYDVERPSWYHCSVDFVVKNGIMVGTESHKFSPYGNTTRGMIATMLWRMEGSNVALGDCIFDDVNSNDYYYEAVKWCYKNNLIEGYGNDLFGPNDYVTREQLAAILYRYAEYKDLNLGLMQGDLLKFKDNASISGWAYSSMSWAVANNIFYGMSEDILSPKTYANRAQIASLFTRFIKEYLY